MWSPYHRLCKSYSKRVKPHTRRYLETFNCVHVEAQPTYGLCSVHALKSTHRKVSIGRFPRSTELSVVAVIEIILVYLTTLPQLHRLHLVKCKDVCGCGIRKWRLQLQILNY